MIRGSQAVKLPVGDVPDWEVGGSDGEPSNLKSPAESFVILQSLKQSRDKWLRSIFPKFSSRGRGGKQPDVVPPPHTIYNRGRCTLQIGPHFFADTTVFEVHYRPLPVTVSQPTFVSAPVSQPVHQPPASLPASSPPSHGESNTPLPPISSTLPVPSGLISQVNTAATVNPTLANLLQLAASGRATPDQLKTLGLLIQPLTSSAPVTGNPTATPQSNAPGTGSSSSLLLTTPAAPQQYQYQAAVKDFDIVIEFRDNPSDRWIFPRGPVVCNFAPAPNNPGSISDLAVTTIVPFSSTTLPQDPATPEASDPTELPPKQVVEFHFNTANSYICDTFSRWVGSKEKMEENRKIIMEIEPPEQQYLAYRLSEGSQLTQIQNAALPSYVMKAIRPSTESGRPKRRSAPRKSTQDPPGSPSTKRKRQTQPKGQIPPPKIACFVCGQANVPLIIGGRYCRPCVESGRMGEASTSQPSQVTVLTKPLTGNSSQSIPLPVEVLASQPESR